MAPVTQSEHAAGSAPQPAAPLAVVVGAGPGMGMALARRFAREGFRVALVAQGFDGLDTSALDRPVLAVAEAADDSSLRRAFTRIRDEAGDPSVLVYNVSAWVEGPASAMERGAFVDGFLAGVAGALTSVQEVVPAMRARGRGTILFTGSEAALRPTAGNAGLAVQKAGLRSLALSLAQDLAADGIHVATVTIRGVLARDTFFDPRLIAETYWDLYEESAGPPDGWRAEVEYARAGPP
jgi:NAD(P)-dependent dehydrogenase (short-subunit alcohol dehydrogenase family)